MNSGQSEKMIGTEMERPNNAAMDELEAILRDIGEMEDAVQTLKQRLSNIPARMAAQIATDDDRIKAARYLYWMLPELSSKAIAEGLLGVDVQELKRHIGSASSWIVCDRCRQPLQFKSRTQRQELIQKVRRFKEKGWGAYAEGYVVLCDPCWVDVQRRRDDKRRQQQEQQRQRLWELRTMPYHEYLKTPEWQERRRHHLKSTGYRCQVCNSAEVLLNVHHRTYERRGEEYYKDLLTLCQACHELFHAQGRLAMD